MQRMRSQSAQAAPELLAVVPLVLVLALALGQVVAAGWALVSAGEAARAGARAAQVGADAGAAARQVLPGTLAPGRVRADDGEVTVTVAAPALLPVFPRIPVTSAAALDPAAGLP